MDAPEKKGVSKEEFVEALFAGTDSSLFNDLRKKREDHGDEVGRMDKGSLLDKIKKTTSGQEPLIKTPNER